MSARRLCSPVPVARCVSEITVRNAHDRAAPGGARQRPVPRDNRSPGVRQPVNSSIQTETAASPERVNLRTGDGGHFVPPVGPVGRRAGASWDLWPCLSAIGYVRLTAQVHQITQEQHSVVYEPQMSAGTCRSKDLGRPLRPAMARALPRQRRCERIQRGHLRRGFPGECDRSRGVLVARAVRSTGR